MTVERMSIKEAIMRAKAIEKEKGNDYTYEELPKVNLVSFCADQLGAKHPARQIIDDKEVYTCNIRLYAGQKQLPGDTITEITEIDDGIKSVVVIQDKVIVPSSDMDSAELMTPKTILFEAHEGGVYDPEIDSVCWTSTSNYNARLCIDMSGRIALVSSKDGTFDLPEDLAKIEDFNLLTAELGIRQTKEGTVRTIFDVLSNTRDTVAAMTKQKMVEADYLSAVSDSVSPKTRLSKYSGKPWSKVAKIEPVGVRSITWAKLQGSLNANESEKE